MVALMPPSTAGRFVSVFALRQRTDELSGGAEEQQVVVRQHRLGKIGVRDRRTGSHRRTWSAPKLVTRTRYVPVAGSSSAKNSGFVPVSFVASSHVGRAEQIQHDVGNRSSGRRRVSVDEDDAPADPPCR